MSDAPTHDEVGLDLDADRPDTFRMRGEVFEIRRVSPKAYARALRALDEVEKNDDAKLEDIWDAQLDFIETAVHPAPPNGHAPVEAFKALREMEFDGIEVRDIRPTMRYIQEVLTGRPTPQPEDSSSGPGSSAVSSKEKPSSPGVARPA